jgi:hypothetical protein
VKERPILMSAPMVRACLRDENPKTQTRRGVRGVPSWDHYGRDIMDWGLSGIHQGDFGEMAGSDRWFLDVQTDVDDNSRREIRCPYGVPGDRLWVRKAFSGPYGLRTMPPALWLGHVPPIWFWADGDPTWGDWTKPKPSIHMPRWACRLVLEITEVRVERLQDISEADARAEGVFPAAVYGGEVQSWLPAEDQRERFWPTAGLAYQALWEKINGAGSWAANPFVWVVSFQRVTTNIEHRGNV